MFFTLSHLRYDSYKDNTFYLIIEISYKIPLTSLFLNLQQKLEFFEILYC